ncbi:MAG TPA: OmpA family protein [Polyangiaceae bacterium]|nr:OmpA family protein [Polyangiaceae bacterium]
MVTHAPTGPGKISTDPRVPSGGVRAVLSNYDIDVDTPKREHIAFLDANVVPILLGKNARIFLQGSASSTGTAAHNLDLSRRRAEKVSAHLQSRGVQVSRIQLDAVGESLASLKTPENAQDRAVSLLAAPLFAPPPPVPVSRPRPAPVTTTHFEVRMLGGLSGGLGPVAVDQLFFEIIDRPHALTSIYVYSGFAGGRGALPISVTLRGPFNKFDTTGAMRTDEFSGPARFTTGGVASFSVNFLNLMGLPRGIATTPNPLSISTGFTVGIGGSTSVGKMILQFTGPFTGP